MLDRFAALKNTIFGVIFRVLVQLAYHLQKNQSGRLFQFQLFIIRGLSVGSFPSGGKSFLYGEL